MAEPEWEENKTLKEVGTTDVAPPSDADYVAVESFDELPLSEEVRRSIEEKGYLKPTPVQAKSLRPVLAGRDVMVRSKTGTGKTAAFGIPLVELVDVSLGAVQSVVLCNTRELAMQVANEIESLGRHKKVQVVAIYGGASMDDQVRKLKAGAQIVVGTPGRVIDLIERKLLEMSNVKTTVLDEADEMLSAGFVDAVRTVLRACPKGHQTLLFSATLPPDLDDLIKSHMNDPETILLSGDVYTVEGIRHVRYYAQDAYPKPRNLLYMLQIEDPESAIIFCNTRDDVNLVATVLNRNGFDADKLSGELTQSDREKVMAKIKRGDVRFMVATDLAARGIDISDLTHVVNYSLPEDPSVYLHRVGRTGRIGKTGTALSIVRGTELVTLTSLEKKFGITFEEKKLPTPEEAQKMWADRHVAELRQSLGSEIFDPYIPLAHELAQRPGGEILLAFALKYFFKHSRAQRKAELPASDDTSTSKEVAASGGRARKRRSERVRAQGGSDDARKPSVGSEKERGAEKAPVVNGAEEVEAPVKPNRLYVSMGSADGFDDAKVRRELAKAAGVGIESIETVELLQGHSYVEVSVDEVAKFLEANGKSVEEKTLSVEVARPRARRRRRRGRGGGAAEAVAET